MEREGLGEEEFRQLSSLVDNLRHEILNPLTVLEGYYRIHDEENPVDDSEAVVDLGNFIENALLVDTYAEYVSKIPEESLEEMQDYLNKNDGYFEELAENLGINNIHVSLENQVKRIVKATNDVYAYQKKLEGHQVDENILLSEFLEPLEESFENLNSGNPEIKSDFAYNGFEDLDLGVDPGLRLVTWTLGKNWEEHAYNGESIELGFEANETNCFYEIDIWDTGKGVYTEFPGDHKGSELRYRETHKLFQDDNSYSGHGLPMAKSISELYDSQIFYSEEMFEGEGFGLKIRIPKF